MLKQENPNTKFAQWFLDPLNKKGPDYDRNNISVQKLAMLIDWFIRNEVEWQVGDAVKGQVRFKTDAGKVERIYSSANTKFLKKLVLQKKYTNNEKRKGWCLFTKTCYSRIFSKALDNSKL